MPSASLRAHSRLFTFDAETGSRRPRWVIFVAGLLSVLLGIGGLSLGVSAASAHDKGYEANCFGLTIKLTNYNTSHPNSVSVVIDGAERVPEPTRSDFGGNYTQTFTWDPATSHTYSINVDGWDGYDMVVPTTTQNPCAKPAVGLTASVCNTTGGTTTLTATASRFASFASTKGPGYPSHTETYTGTLYRDGAPYKTVANVQTDADGTFSWPGEEAGHLYTWEVKGTTNGSLSASAAATVVNCPQLQDFSISPNQCSATTGNNASVSVTATVVPGRAYTVQVLKDGAPYGASHSIPASNTLANYPVFTLGVPENVSGLSVLITDTAAAADDPNKTKQSITFSTGPCPQDPGVPVVTADVCTVVGGTTALHATFSGLVPGRAYDILVNGVKVHDLTASASTFPATGTWDHTVPAGSYVVTIVDELVPAVTTSAPSVDVAACPTQPQITLTPTQCSVPGGSGTITATFGGLATGRDYTLTINDGGSAVPGYPAKTITGSAPAETFTGLIPGHSYTVTVVDKLAPLVLDAASLTLTACPQTPTVTLTLQCDILTGTSNVGVTLDKLAAGQSYTVSIEDDKGASAGTPVTVTTASASAPTFTVPNGAFYTVTIANVANPLITASADIYAAVCDIPTFPLPPEFPELPTLALTGAGDTTMPMLGALGLVQFGVALLALAAMLQFAPRRRQA